MKWMEGGEGGGTVEGRQRAAPSGTQRHIFNIDHYYLSERSEGGLDRVLGASEPSQQDRSWQQQQQSQPSVNRSRRRKRRRRRGKNPGHPSTLWEHPGRMGADPSVQPEASIRKRMEGPQSLQMKQRRRR